MLRDESNNRSYYDDFSAGYERERGHGYHRMLDQLESELVVPLARGKRVLEAGCGTGLILEQLARATDEAYGIDLSPGMVTRARARGLRVALGSVTAIPFADETFDMVCSFKVLAHVSDIGGALAELTRVTRVGGQLALEFYNPLSLRYLAKRLAGPQPIGAGRTEADVYTRWDSPREIARMLPPNLVLQDFRGVRVVTPAAVFHRLPMLAQGLPLAERAASTSVFRYFGGFLVALLRKKSRR